jgi:hypothetical protein
VHQPIDVPLVIHEQHPLLLSDRWLLHRQFTSLHHLGNP